MRLETGFTVPAPLQQAWTSLRDMDNVASCLPDGSLRRLGGGDVYGGGMTIEANGSKLNCWGTLRAIDADEDEHAANVQLRGREVAGTGIAQGMIHARVAPSSGATRVELKAGLALTGQRLDDEVAQEIAGRLLDQFAHRLEHAMLERVPLQRPDPGEAAPTEAPSPPAEAPSFPTETPSPLHKRVGRPSVAAAVGLALLLAGLAPLARRRRRISVTIRFRW